MPPRRKKKEPWDIAKPILLKDYQEGRVTDFMKPKDVWNMRDEFKAVQYVNFRANFSAMKRRIKEKKKEAEIEEAGFRLDMAKFTLAKDIDGYWNGSPAERLLKQDISEKRHEQMKPQLLWNSRPEYQKFDLNKFRGHVHQELRSKRERNYWLVKRMKKAEEAKRNGKK